MTDDSREAFDHDPVEHAEARAGMTVGELAAEYGSTGFGGGALHEAVDIYAEMLGDGVTNFVGLAGAMVPAGMRRVVTDLVRDGHVDALVTTGANLTHDTIEAIGGHHHHGEEPPEEERRAHDEQLREEASTVSTTSTSHRSTSRPSSHTSGRKSSRSSPRRGL